MMYPVQVKRPLSHNPTQRRPPCEDLNDVTSPSAAIRVTQHRPVADHIKRRSCPALT